MKQQGQISNWLLCCDDGMHSIHSLLVLHHNVLPLEAAQVHFRPNC
jgi:hypothetical protein